MSILCCQNDWHWRSKACGLSQMVGAAPFQSVTSVLLFNVTHQYLCNQNFELLPSCVRVQLSPAHPIHACQRDLQSAAHVLHVVCSLAIIAAGCKYLFKLCKLVSTAADSAAEDVKPSTDAHTKVLVSHSLLCTVGFAYCSQKAH